MRRPARAHAAPRLRHLLYRGLWFSPVREALDALVARLMAPVTGEVRVELYKAGFAAAGVDRRSRCTVHLFHLRCAAACASDAVDSSAPRPAARRRSARATAGAPRRPPATPNGRSSSSERGTMSGLRRAGVTAAQGSSRRRAWPGSRRAGHGVRRMSPSSSRTPGDGAGVFTTNRGAGGAVSGRGRSFGRGARCGPSVEQRERQCLHRSGRPFRHARERPRARPAPRLRARGSARRLDRCDRVPFRSSACSAPSRRPSPVSDRAAPTARQRQPPS